MKKTKFGLLVAALLFSTGIMAQSASTGPNKVYLEQIGSSNTITIEQVGGTNNVGGTGGSVAVATTGISTLTVTAPSSTNYATINGSSNTVGITQTGSSDSAQYNIKGSNNSYTSTVTGNSNQVDITLTWTVKVKVPLIGGMLEKHAEGEIRKFSQLEIEIVEDEFSRKVKYDATTCTASLLEGGHVITAAHCLPKEVLEGTKSCRNLVFLNKRFKKPYRCESVLWFSSIYKNEG